MIAARLCLSTLLAASLLLSGCAQHAAIRAATPAATAMDRQIRNAVDAGEGDYVLRALRQRVIENPGDLAARLELGHAYETRGCPELALEHYRLAAERFPESAPAHLDLARSLRTARLAPEAVRTFGDFLQAHPQHSVAYASWLGILRDDSGDWKAGETAHREAIEIALAEGQDKDYLHNNLGYCLLKQGRKDESAVEFRSAIALNGASEIARNNLGLAVAGNPREAILNWQSVSEPAAAHNNMAAVFIEQRNYPEARAEIERALGYNRSHSAALANLKLVSQLDGKPATVPLAAVDGTRMSRGMAAVKRWFAGPAKSESADNKQTASR